MKLLQTIHWPVYQLPRKPDIEGKLVTIDDKVIDDTSIEGNSLGKRRLHINKPYKLHNAIYYVKDMVKLSSGTTWFIDSTGFYFKYTKTKMVQLVFKKITKVIPILTGGALLEVANNNPRFKVMYAPNDQELYAGLLRFSPYVYVLYGLYDKQYKDTRRKV